MQEDKMPRGLIIGGMVGIAVLLFFIFCFRSVEAGQVGIVTRFGEVDRVASSGIALKFPWPIERLHKMEIRVQKEEQESTAATRDLQDVRANLALNYAIDNETALRIFKELGTDYKNRVIIPAVQESFKASSANYTAEELVTQRPKAKQEALEVIKDRLEKYGIRVVDLNITNLSYGAEFNAAIEAVQVAKQNALKAEQDLERVKVEAEQKITQAKADAEAQRLQQQTLTPEMLQKYAIDKWQGNVPTYFGGNSQFLFNIPLQGN